MSQTEPTRARKDGVMPAKCKECNVGFREGVCPNCGALALAAQILQYIGRIASKEGHFRVRVVIDLAKEQGIVEERSQAYNVLCTLWEWGAITPPQHPKGFRRLTGKGRRMIEVGATHKNFPLTNRASQTSSRSERKGCEMTGSGTDFGASTEVSGINPYSDESIAKVGQVRRLAQELFPNGLGEGASITIEDCKCHGDCRALQAVSVGSNGNRTTIADNDFCATD